jgi:hypothetical protein
VGMRGQPADRAQQCKVVIEAARGLGLADDVGKRSKRFVDVESEILRKYY